MTTTITLKKIEFSQGTVNDTPTEIATFHFEVVREDGDTANVAIPAPWGDDVQTISISAIPFYENGLRIRWRR